MHFSFDLSVVQDSCTALVEELYYPCSENKGADQLRCNREADLRLCFRIYRLLVFPCGGSYCIVYEPSNEKTNNSDINQAQSKLAYTFTEAEKNLEIYVAKTKALISYAFTGKLICAFVFAEALCLFFICEGSYPLNDMKTILE